MSNISDFGSKKILARNLVQIPAPLWNQNAPKQLATRDSRGVRGFQEFLNASCTVLSDFEKILALAISIRSGFLGGLVAKYRHSNAATFELQIF